MLFDRVEIRGAPMNGERMNMKSLDEAADLARPAVAPDDEWFVRLEPAVRASDR
jgi:hypothetical protein